MKMSSNRKFGFLFSAILALALTYVASKESVSTDQLALLGLLCLITLSLSIIYPDALGPFNKLWIKSGIILGKVLNPIIIGLIFFGLITPLAIFMRIIGRDELGLKMINKETYWKERGSKEPEPKSFRNQF